jgi:hypothetical protein
LSIPNFIVADRIRGERITSKRAVLYMGAQVIACTDVERASKTSCGVSFTVNVSGCVT